MPNLFAYRSDGILIRAQCAAFAHPLSVGGPRIITSFSRRCSLNYRNPRGSVLSRARPEALTSRIFFHNLRHNHPEHRGTPETRAVRVRIRRSCRCAPFFCETPRQTRVDPATSRGRIAGHVYKDEVHLAVMRRVSRQHARRFQSSRWRTTRSLRNREKPSRIPLDGRLER